MKNKIRLITVAAALLIGSMPLTAFAQVPDNVDTSVIDEDTETKEDDHTPLTPDGNMTLVDDITTSDGHAKQFMTVTTKSGHIFYIIVDRDDKGTNTVHFLNQVDERDLMDLISDEDKEEIEAATGTKVEPKATETEPTDATSEDTDQADKTSKKKTAGPNPILGLCIVLGLAGVGGFYWYSNRDSFKRKKNGADPDSDYADDYIEMPGAEDEKGDE